jgi:glycolate oxidase
MQDQFDPVAIETMKNIKRALDPNLILNPGKLVGEC